MNKPLITVIVPIFRVDKYLHQCIDSLVGQTYKNLEIILVDDGSDDDCPSICDEYANKDKRIQVIHKKNGGADSARKAGIKLAKGDYVGYVDGDDWVEPEMYEAMALEIEKHDSDTVIVGMIENYKESERMRIPFLDEGFYDKDAFFNEVAPKIIFTGDFYRSSISTSLSDKIMKRENVLRFQLSDGMDSTASDDAMVCFPAVLSGNSLSVIHKCLYHYRNRNDSLKHVLNEDIPSQIKAWYHVWKNNILTARKDCSYEYQLQIYLLYLLALKCPAIFDNSQKTYLNLYGGVKAGSRIVVYGAGQAGINLVNYISSIPTISIIAWSDREYSKIDTAKKLTNPRDLLMLDYDYLLVAIMRRDAYEDAVEDLMNIGVPQEKIRWISNDIVENASHYINSITSND